MYKIIFKYDVKSSLSNFITISFASSPHIEELLHPRQCDFANFSGSEHSHGDSPVHGSHGDVNMAAGSVLIQSSVERVYQVGADDQRKHLASMGVACKGGSNYFLAFVLCNIHYISRHDRPLIISG